MKKLVSLFLALALCLGLGTTALAGDQPALPDPSEFFHESVDYMTSYNDYSYVYMVLKAGSRQAMDEYMAHLREDRFGLTLIRDFEESSIGYDSIHHYVFDYTGAGDVPSVNWAEELSYKDESRDQVGTGDLWIEIRSNDVSRGEGMIGCCMQISFANDAFSFEDFGGRSTMTDLYAPAGFGDRTGTGPITYDSFDRPDDKTGSSGGSGSSGAPRTGDTDYTMRVGDSLQLDCPRKFGADGEQFRWAVDEGAGLVSLTGEINSSCTVTAKAPGRVVVSVLYDYSYRTKDVLTGNDTYGFASPTYYFIIEVTP